MVESGWEAEVILSREDPGIAGPYVLDGVKVFPYTDKRQIIRATRNSQLLISHLENYERVAVVGRNYRVPVVHVVHNDMDITKAYMGHGCDLAVFNTDWVLKSFVERPVKGSQSFSKPSVVVHPRVDTLRYSSPSESLSEGSRTKWPYDVALVNLWDGGGNEAKASDGKGAHTFYELARRFPNKKFLGVVGGYGEQRIEDHPNVTILPHTSSIMEDVYSKTRVLLMPSRYESFGRVAIEGAACGIPTIASPTPGLKEALGEQNFYADPDDYDEWEQIIRYLDEDDVYLGNSHTARQRALYWYKKQPQELEEFLVKANSIAQTGLYLRGY
jgi:glycosyltransferase involved in cell wall biosynthesis